VRTIKFGRDSVQLVPAHALLVIDTTSHCYDVAGHRHTEHATLGLPLSIARDLSAALQDAIEQAEAIDHPAQAALWSDATVARVAERMPRRVRGGASL
jgi:hypothetical protein